MRTFRLGVALLAFIVVALLTFTMAWLVGQHRRCIHEVQVVEQLIKAHGRQCVNAEFEDGPTWLTKIVRRDVFRRLTALGCNAPGNSFSFGRDDAGRLLIERRYITGLTDDEMASVKTLQYLRSLGLEANPIADRSVIGLRSLRCLETLNLSHTAISDQAMKELAELPALRNLDLSRTDVTDASLQYLSKCASLQKLNVEMTNISEDGAAMLQKQIPNCVVVR